MVDKDGIKNWVSITDYIPCRIGSIAKIRFNPSGKNLGKIVRVDSINYETGLASITILPEMVTDMIHIRSLEEVLLNTENQLNYEKVFSNYFHFLKLVYKYSQNEFQSGINITSSSQKMKSFNEELFNFDNVTTKILLRNYHYTLTCHCIGHAENPKLLCKHLVYAINNVAINKSYLNMDLSNHNPIMRCMLDFINTNSENLIESFYFDLHEDEKIVFKEFLKYYSLVK